jgi:hypothetical protein
MGDVINGKNWYFDASARKVTLCTVKDIKYVICTCGVCHSSF